MDIKTTLAPTEKEQKTLPSPIELLKNENDKLREVLKNTQVKIAELTRLLQLEKSINNSIALDIVEIPTIIFNKINAIKQEVGQTTIDKIAATSILRKDEMERLRQQIDDVLKDKELTKEKELVKTEKK